MEGWIKLYRQFIKWEWYKDSHTKDLFIHLLLLANHEENQWQGKTIKRGQLITSVNHLAEECGISTQNVRTSLKKLKSTHEITIKTTNKYTLVTIENYDKFQGEVIEITHEPTSKLTIKQQTTNNQLTTNKNDKNDNNIYFSYFINKIRETDLSTFQKRMNFLHNIQEEEEYKHISPDEEHELRMTVMRIKGERKW